MQGDMLILICIVFVVVGLFNKDRIKAFVK